MNPRTAFLRTIATHRFNHLPRLVFADFLDEQSNTADANTAEFIRVGVALASGVEVRRPSSVCDCERCRLVRRQAELFDVMANTTLLTDSGFDGIGLDAAFDPPHYSGGFPAICRVRRVCDNLPAIPLAVGRVFRCLPVTFMAVRFHTFGGRPSHQMTWMITVAVADATSSRGQRVSATVGPMVNENSHISFSCEYPVDHDCRVPTLVRKAVRRCLTNRESNSETMSPPTNRPVPPARLTPAVHPIMRRRRR